jgi:hypothetical protein
MGIFSEYSRSARDARLGGGDLEDQHVILDAEARQLEDSRGAAGASEHRLEHQCRTEEEQGRRIATRDSNGNGERMQRTERRGLTQIGRASLLQSRLRGAEMAPDQPADAGIPVPAPGVCGRPVTSESSPRSPPPPHPSPSETPPGRVSTRACRSPVRFLRSARSRARRLCVLWA